MKRKWLALILLLGGVLLFVTGCNIRVTSTAVPTAELAAGTQPSPTRAQPTRAQPTQGQQAPTQTPGGPTPPRPTPPPELASPQLTAQGTLEGGTPYGITADGQYFKGNPQATVIIFEFSDFQ